jgi:SIR2-like protein
LPNRTLNKKYLPNPALFKLHGDTQDEVIYIKNEEGLIFSRKQYLRSLTANQDLLNVFFEDFTGKNCIMIGCSLDNEIDLEYLFANNRTGAPAQTDKIYVTSQEPDDLKKINLSDFGVNVCLIITNYNSFYKELVEVLQDAEMPDQDIFFQVFD